METTLNAIRDKHPCANGWKKLLANLGKTAADDEPLSLITILDSNGLYDALWCLRAVTGYDKEIRLFAVWCATASTALDERPSIHQCAGCGRAVCERGCDKRRIDAARAARMGRSLGPEAKWPQPSLNAAWAGR